MAEFAARERLHDEGVMGTRSHSTVDRGHYSRWEASPTTFGPAVRIGASVFLVGFLVIGLFLVFFILWFVQVFVTGWLLKEIWRPGWVAPGVDRRTAPSYGPAAEPIRAGFRVPPPAERVEPVRDRPRTAGEVAGLVSCAIAGVALVTVFTLGTPEMRLGAIMVPTLLGMYAFFRSFLS